jgi:hypothetical protein
MPHVLTEPDETPHDAEDGDGDDLQTHTPPPNLPVLATPQASSHGVTKQKRLREILKKITIYSQNIQGSGRNQKEDTDTYKFDHITSLMEERGIDIYLVQETWLNDEYKSHSVVNGYYLFHHGTNEASDSIDEEEEENPPHQISRKGHTKGGVAIFLSPKATAAWKRAGQHDPIVSGNTHGCARYIAIKLHFFDHLGEIVKVHACSVYHPTTKLSQQKRLEFLDELDNLYDRLDKDDHILLAGCDTNSSIGTRNSSYCHPDGTVEENDENREIIGPHGIDHINLAGIDLMNLMKAKNLAAATSFFKHKDYTTWRSFSKTNAEREEDGESIDPNTRRQTQFQLDQCLTQKCNIRRILDARKIEGGAPSDHAPIKIVLRLATRMSRKKKKTRFSQKTNESKKKRIKIDWRLLRSKKARALYNHSIREKLENINNGDNDNNNNNNTADYYTKFVKVTIEAAEENIAGEGRKSKDWFKLSEDILNEAIRARNHWAGIWRQTSMTGARQKFREARSNLKSKIKTAKRRWHEKQAEEIHDMKFDPKSAWAATREVQAGFDGHYSAQSDIKMKMENNEMAKNDSDNADVMGKHFSKVFNNHRPIDLTVLEELEQRETIESLGHPPTEAEFKKALWKMANGKSPGESGITPEAIKGLDFTHSNIMFEFLTLYWTDTEIDYNEWHRNSLCALRKPGKGKDYSDPNNWRGICLAEIPAKIQSSIISDRLLHHLERVGIETQYGCVPGKGCADALFAIKTALQIRKQHGKNTWAVFVDLVKAFDTADHQLLFKILKKYGIPDTLITVIEKMYNDSVVVFKIGKEEREVPYRIGVKQGDNMAPVLFIYLMNAVAETLSNKWDFNKLEYNWFPESANGNKRGKLTGQSPKAMGSKFDLFYFLYVDDGAMLFENREDLKKGTNLIMSHFARFGLEMHIGRNEKQSKTECVYFPAFDHEYDDADTSNFAVAEGFVQFTRQFKYLGSTISFNLDDTMDIDLRISQASKAMGALRNYFRCKQISLYAKRLIYLAIPVNLCLWGVEAWAISECNIRKLKVFHTRSLRSILQINIYDVKDNHIRNTDILSMMNVPTMENIIAKRQLNWMGKMVRMDENRLPLKMLSCWMNESRPSRRPPTSTRNSMIRSLQILDPNISDDGNLRDWFHLARDESEWNSKLESLDPTKPTDEHHSNHCPTQARPDELAALNTEPEIGEIHTPLSPTGHNASNEDSRTALHMRTNSTNMHPLYSSETELYWPSNAEFGNRSPHRWAEAPTPPNRSDCQLEIIDSESWRYRNHRPPPLVIPHLTEARHTDSSSPTPLGHSSFQTPFFFNTNRNYGMKTFF